MSVAKHSNDEVCGLRFSNRHGNVGPSAVSYSFSVVSRSSPLALSIKKIKRKANVHPTLRRFPFSISGIPLGYFFLIGPDHLCAAMKGISRVQKSDSIGEKQCARNDSKAAY